MTVVMAIAVLLTGCQGPKGDPGPQGPPGYPGMPGASGKDFVIPDGGAKPQSIACAPGENFCAGSRIATCTFSGFDAVLSTDCKAQGSATNPASCVTSECPAGQFACCRHAKPIWKFNFSQPALIGEAYTPSYDTGYPYLAIDTSCDGSDQSFAGVTLIRNVASCPSSYSYIDVKFDRTKLTIGTAYSFPTDGLTMVASFDGSTCAQWSGTAKIDSGFPDWSVSINAICTTAKVSLSIVGSMSGSR